MMTILPGGHVGVWALRLLDAMDKRRIVTTLAIDINISGNWFICTIVER